MTLSQQDRAYVHEVSINAARDVAKEVIEEVMKWHVSSCPHGQMMTKAKWAIIGGFITSALGGGAVGATVVRLLM